MIENLRNSYLLLSFVLFATDYMYVLIDSHLDSFHYYKTCELRYTVSTFPSVLWSSLTMKTAPREMRSYLDNPSCPLLQSPQHYLVLSVL